MLFNYRVFLCLDGAYMIVYIKDGSVNSTFISTQNPCFSSTFKYGIFYFFLLNVANFSIPSNFFKRPFRCEQKPLWSSSTTVISDKLYLI